MKTCLLRWLLLTAAITAWYCAHSRVLAETPARGLVWKDWSEAIFQQAQSTRKLVLLDLEAVWCHWCHVMDQKTYSDPAIASILTKDFLLVRADQDAHPGLSARYQEYGWPAIVIFDADGHELKKLSGFIEPKPFLEILQKVMAHPVLDERPVRAMVRDDAKEGSGDGLRGELIVRYLNALDRDNGGLLTNHKYLDPDSIEFGIQRAHNGEDEDRAWVTRTLDANRALIDPIWGGVYQYSTHGDWEHPHFEKIASSQAAAIALYSLGHTVLGEKRYLGAAENITAYMNTFLRSSDGAYFTSQDADVKSGEHSGEYFKLSDRERRAIGIPKIDNSIYARENGWLIESLCKLYTASSQQRYLDDAIQAARWVIEHRVLPGGGFAHGEHDEGGPFLADTLSMGRGFLELYSVTADRIWLRRAEEAAAFIAATFADRDGKGFYSTAPAQVSVLEPVRVLDENIATGRFANLLFHYTGEEAFQVMADKAMHFIVEPGIAFETISEPGIILLQDEIKDSPVHIAVVGKKSDPAAVGLWKTALSAPAIYVRREWWDREEGAMRNPDVQYPKLPRAAAFICANKRCSLPLFSKDELVEAIKKAFVRAK